tara:strand:- start:258 stop:560 length:303 start_codon:yes stop_codon:yes gene_type:complete
MNTKTLIATLIILSAAFFNTSSFAQSAYGGYTTSETRPNPFTGGYTTRSYGSSGNTTTEHRPNPFTGGYTSRTYGSSGSTTTEHRPNPFTGGYTSRTYGW